MIFGSYVEHGVRRILEGTRISIIFFYKVDTTFNELLLLWNHKPEQCQFCLNSFSNKDSLRKHYKICKKKILFSRFKDEGDDENNDNEEENIVEKNIEENNEDKAPVIVLDTKTKLTYSKNKQCYKCKKICRTKRNLKTHRLKCLKETHVTK